MLNEWAEAQSEKIDETRKQLKEKWEKNAIRQQYHELEEQLHEQSQRIKSLMAEYKASVA
jgi:stearoyl-CoA desaturase (delta-9 desaturase)